MFKVNQGLHKNIKKPNAVRVCLLWFAACTALMIPITANAQWNEPGFDGSTTSEPTEPIIEWEKHQNADQRLTAFGDDLMGDGIDPHTGGITFEHTDIVLPGNSGLDVSIRRRRAGCMDLYL